MLLQEGLDPGGPPLRRKAKDDETFIALPHIRLPCTFHQEPRSFATLASIQANCQADDKCVAFNYNQETGEGQLCEDDVNSVLKGESAPDFTAGFSAGLRQSCIPMPSHSIIRILASFISYPSASYSE